MNYTVVPEMILWCHYGPCSGKKLALLLEKQAAENVHLSDYEKSFLF
jgi:hypothetical protein